MFAYFLSLLPRLEILGSFLYWLIFLSSFLESLAFVGYLIPGTAVMLVSGVLASQHVLRFTEVSFVVAMGGIVGDAVSYALGKKGTKLFGQKSRLFKTEYLVSGEKFFLKHGNRSVFFARFFGPIRPMIPFVAGMFNMRASTFFFYNIVSALCSAPLYVALGYFFAESSSRVEHMFGRVGFAVLVFLLVVYFLYRYKKTVLKLGEDFFSYCNEFLRAVYIFIRTKPRVEHFIEHHPKGVNFLSRRFSRLDLFGIPLTCLVFISLIIFCSWFGIVTDLLNTSALHQTDVRVTHYFFVHRNRFITYIVWTLTYGASVWAVCVASVANLIFLWRKKYVEFVLPFMVSALGAMSSVSVIKFLVARPRPQGVSVYKEQLFSFPSFHSVAVVAVYGFVAYTFVCISKKWSTKYNSVFFTIIFALIIGFSRIYLGVHFFTDVAGGYVIGFLWLWFGISMVRITRNFKNI
jgi:undecaprenyl-diphosphatase